MRNGDRSAARSRPQQLGRRAARLLEILHLQVDLLTRRQGVGRRIRRRALQKPLVDLRRRCAVERQAHAVVGGHGEGVIARFDRLYLAAPAHAEVVRADAAHVRAAALRLSGAPVEVDLRIGLRFDQSRQGTVVVILTRQTGSRPDGCRTRAGRRRFLIRVGAFVRAV